MGSEHEPPTPPIDAPTIDADDLFEAMTMSDEYRAFLSLESGEVDIVPRNGDLWDWDHRLAEEHMDYDRFREIERVDAKRRHDWMTSFAASLDDAPDVAERLQTTLTGRGAFRGFRDALEGHPDLLARWSAWQAERLVAHAHAWLRSEGLHNPLSTPRALATRRPGRTDARAEPEIGLVHVLLLGAPEGRTELLDGRVTRVVMAPDARRADQLFRRLVRDACGLHDREYRRSLVEGQTKVTIDDLTFVRRGLTIEVEVAVSLALWRAFDTTGV